MVSVSWSVAGHLWKLFGDFVEHSSRRQQSRSALREFSEKLFSGENGVVTIGPHYSTAERVKAVPEILGIEEWDGKTRENMKLAFTRNPPKVVFDYKEIFEN